MSDYEMVYLTLHGLSFTGEKARIRRYEECEKFFVLLRMSNESMRERFWLQTSSKGSNMPVKRQDDFDIKVDVQ